MEFPFHIPCLGRAKGFGLALLGGLAVAMVPCARANLVFDGSFEILPSVPTFQTYTAGASFGAWQVTSGSVDLIGSYWRSADGVRSMDLDTLGGLQGTISQTVLVPAAGDYLLSFWFSGNPSPPFTKELSVSIGDVLSQTFTYDIVRDGVLYNTRNEMKWELRLWQVHLPAGPLSLSFANVSSTVSFAGTAVDNVRLDAILNGQFPAIPQPQPGSVTLTPPFGNGDYGYQDPFTPIPEGSTFCAGALLLLPFAFAVMSRKHE